MIQLRIAQHTDTEIETMRNLFQDMWVDFKTTYCKVGKDCTTCANRKVCRDIVDVLDFLDTKMDEIKGGTTNDHR